MADDWSEMERERKKIIKSLYSELDSIEQRAKQSRSRPSSTLSASPPHDDNCLCGDCELRSRITTGRTKLNGSHSSSKTSMSLDVTAKLRDFALDCIETPMSPSQTVFNDKSHTYETNTGRLGELTKPKPLTDHQFCFDMDLSATEAGKDQNHSGSKGFWENPRLSRNRFDSCSSQKQALASATSLHDSSGISSLGGSEISQPTHRATHHFIPRHDDEMLLDVGDPVYVEHEMEDYWCYGVNLRTGQKGIFPLAHVFEIDFEEDCGSALSLRLKAEDKATFYLTFLGSIEVAYHKGNDVLVQGITKVLDFYQSKAEIVAPHSVLLDVSFRGIHVIDKSRRNFFRCPNFDYFYSLQNISFCGAHPKQLRYFGFITKHPLLPRFACHVFLSNSSTQPIVDAIGRAFKRSYDEYMAFAHPTEDIYMD